MALITEPQAQALYSASIITKITQDSDPTKGTWEVLTSLDGFDYTYEADETVLAMNATDQQVKDKFIEIAQTEEYKGVAETYTETIVNKV